MTFQLQIQQCRPPPPQLRLKNNNISSIRSTLTKQGQRFLTKLTTTTNTDNLITKFVHSSSKSVLLSTLTHLLSLSPTNNNNLSSLALPVSLSLSLHSFLPKLPSSRYLILQFLSHCSYTQESPNHHGTRGTQLSSPISSPSSTNSNSTQNPKP
jgi:hypothetical protein